MPLVETLPVGADTAQWSVWGTVARVVVTDPAATDDAAAVVREELAAVDLACSRFRADSELRQVTPGRAVEVSPLLAELVAAALRAARETGGDVDPTVGAALCGLGYDRDFAAITGRRVAPAVRVFAAPDWRAVRLRDGYLSVPLGVLLDLGATAKAVAADRCAARVSERLGVGAMVALGGDIATAGPGPDGGWRVLVQDKPGDPSHAVRLPPGSAIATSSTASRTWGHLHHILDPRTGLPAPRVWRTVTVAAGSCLRANTLTTAAIVRGRRASSLLRGVPSRLVTPELDVVRLGGWPS
ncbi:FAD:protein FMN transferase [Paractinoplanes atraurantiacus]|uniref:FAD:protein FMN transferase n=1 Tax=Paractinoplanes atraurantiacus TaxID=1036182 RepID=A0A285J9C9_9ACTN|nr:FAD:protein FMN transferase [Actinoplanes atraurantiacus]SNY56905.1 thiamine biosynthesis lipoprotein [Actinoplanes atraurantiacus]